MMEKWRGIQNYPNYEVSNMGRVLGKRFRGKYPCVVLYNGEGSKDLLVHRLVALTFLHKPDRIHYYEVNHKDGNCANNHVRNLEWVTKSQNIKHAVENNLIQTPNNKGERNPVAKLNWRKVRFIRRLYRPREKYFGAKHLAKKLGVSYQCIISITNGTNWKE